MVPQHGSLIDTKMAEVVHVVGGGGGGVGWRIQKGSKKERKVQRGMERKRVVDKKGER